MLATGGVDETMAAREGPAVVQQVIELILDVLAVIWMLVREEQFVVGTTEPGS